MLKYDVRTPEDALLYLADCQLATVCDLAVKKSRIKSDYARQKEIAQLFCDWIKEFKIPVVGNNRVGGVSVAGSVDVWAKRFEPK
jgi:hypothetical protein